MSEGNEPRLLILTLLVLLLLPGCGRGAAPLIGVFPEADVLPGWAPSGDVELFDRENIYALVDGQAEAFFAYGFEQVAVRRYENEEGRRLEIEIWQVGAPADAYGLFTVNISGIPAGIGNGGDVDPGRRLAFWQDRYYVRVRAHRRLSDDELWAFAEAVAAALPSGGERPALVDHLPLAGLIERSIIFFHEEISIQGELWLGGKNLLRLGPETDGVLARYRLDGTTAQLLLVEYPSAGRAAAGRKALEGSQLSGLVAADVRGKLLGAAFGTTAETVVAELLVRALENR